MTRDVRHARLRLDIARQAARRERRDAPAGGTVSPRPRQVAEDALVGAHLLGDVLAADEEVHPPDAAVGGVELEAGLAEPVPGRDHRASRPPGRTPARPTAWRRSGSGSREAGDRIGGSTRARAPDPRRRSGTASPVMAPTCSPRCRRAGRGGTRGRTGRARRSTTSGKLEVADRAELHVAAHEVAAKPLRGREVEGVLVGRIVEQPLILGVDAEDAGATARDGDRDHQLGGAVPLLAAVVGQQVGLVGAGIERDWSGGGAFTGSSSSRPATSMRGHQADAARPAVRRAAEHAADRGRGPASRRTDGRSRWRRGPPTTRRDRG